MPPPVMTRDEAMALVIEAACNWAETITNDDPPRPKSEIQELWGAIDFLRSAPSTDGDTMRTELEREAFLREHDV